MSIYLHEFLFLLLTGADGVPDGADLAEDGLRLLQLVATRAVGHLKVDPGVHSGEGGAGKETREEDLEKISDNSEYFTSCMVSCLLTERGDSIIHLKELELNN